MNTRLMPVVVILSILTLGACSVNATPTEETELDSIYTAAASTLSAEEILITPTPSATFFVTSTPFTLSTTIQQPVAIRMPVSSS